MPEYGTWVVRYPITSRNLVPIVLQATVTPNLSRSGRTSGPAFLAVCRGAMGVAARAVWHSAGWTGSSRADVHRSRRGPRIPMGAFNLLFLSEQGIPVGIEVDDAIRRGLWPECSRRPGSGPSRRLGSYRGQPPRQFPSRPCRERLLGLRSVRSSQFRP
jgi:hypothetical protein